LGLRGAAITASLAYSTSLIYQIIVFVDRTRSHWTDLLPNSSDKDRAFDLLHTLKR
jgi:hypothetical protein